MGSSSSIAISPTGSALSESERVSLVHTRAVCLAFGIVVLALPIMNFVAPLVVRPFMRELLALAYSEKDQGMQVQLEALQRPDVLPLFGSSELRTEKIMRPDQFFETKPTGFEVCPVGRAGNTTFMMAQKIAALGEAVRGRKMAFIICHFWFRRSQTPASHIAGNLSPLQTITLLQDPALDEGLRRRFVNRLLEYPTAIDDYGLIDAYLHSVEKQGWAAEARRAFLDRLLRLQHGWLTWDDRIGSVEALFKYRLLGGPSWEEKPAQVSWAQLIAKKESEAPEEQKRRLENFARLNNGSADEEFLGPLRTAKEWEDFALLLDTLKYYQADPLFISVPLPGPRLDRFNVSRNARQYFHDRVTAMCRERGFPVETFPDQELAIDFLEGSGTHLEEKGWIYVDRLLDDFYHNRLRVAGKAKKS